MKKNLPCTNIDFIIWPLTFRKFLSPGVQGREAANTLFPGASILNSIISAAFLFLVRQVLRWAGHFHLELCPSLCVLYWEMTLLFICAHLCPCVFAQGKSKQQTSIQPRGFPSVHSVAQASSLPRLSSAISFPTHQLVHPPARSALPPKCLPNPCASPSVSLFPTLDDHHFSHN